MLIFHEKTPGEPDLPDKKSSDGCVVSAVPIASVTLEYDDATRTAWTYDGVTERPLKYYCDCDVPAPGCACMQSVDDSVMSYNIFPCTHVDEGEACPRFLRTLGGTCWRHSH
jgi:hypothetical protein